MQVNFNNQGIITLFSTDDLPSFALKVQNAITGNMEHFWLEYKIGGESNEIKFLRTEKNDDDIVNGSVAFIRLGILKNITKNKPKALKTKKVKKKK